MSDPSETSQYGMPIDDYFLSEFFSMDRIENRSHSSRNNSLGFLLLDEEDDCFQKALIALQSVGDTFINDNGNTDNELDGSHNSSEANYDNSNSNNNNAYAVAIANTSSNIATQQEDDGSEDQEYIGTNAIQQSTKKTYEHSNTINNTLSTNDDSSIKLSTNAIHQQKMNQDLSIHIESMDIANPSTQLFENVDHSSLLLENDIHTSKRFRLDSSEFSGINTNINKLSFVQGLSGNGGNNKRCEEPGCFKFPQGSTRFCISHGGGRRCTYENCSKGARDKYFCAAHGGGKRCSVLTCNKSAVGGSISCATHGGGKKCSYTGCTKSAQSPTCFCVMHGGGKKCSIEGCTKVSRGKTSFCASHGGGPRCHVMSCDKAALGKTKYCRLHTPTSSDNEDNLLMGSRPLLVSSMQVLSNEHTAGMN